MKIITSICFILFISFALYADIGDSIKSQMFCLAFENFSTAPNYVVIKVKNTKTGETKEICTESNFVTGAINEQNGISTFGIDCKKYKNRYFEFSKKKALYNISFDLYTKTDLEKYSQTINVADIVKQVKSGKLTSRTFNGERKEQIMFAHLMFNNGIMVTRGCIAGNVCGLKYFKVS